MMIDKTSRLDLVKKKPIKLTNQFRLLGYYLPPQHDKILVIYIILNANASMRYKNNDLSHLVSLNINNINTCT